MGIATCTVAEIFDKFSNISGNNLTIASLISSRHIIKAVTHCEADLLTKPARNNNCYSVKIRTFLKFFLIKHEKMTNTYQLRDILSNVAAD